MNRFITAIKSAIGLSAAATAAPNPSMEIFAQAKTAFEKRDFNNALSLLMNEVRENPKNIAGHLLIGKCFANSGRFPVAINVYSTLVTSPEVRGNAELPKNEIDLLMVEAILGWAKEIESEGFPEQHLKLFTKAVRFYEGESFRGVRSVEIVGLDEGLQRRMAVTDAFAEIIQSKQNA